MASLDQLEAAGVLADLEGFEGALSGSFSVAYPAGGFDPGDELLAPMTHVAPSAVSYKADAAPSEKYTLILTDPDAPDRSTHAFREFVHYVASDITGESLAAGGALKGTTVLDYLGVGAPCKSGLHRYVFLLFAQPADSKPANLAQAFEGRGGKKVCLAAKAVGLGPVVAATFYQSQWDESIDAVHTAMGWLPPPQFRSPAQEAANPAITGDTCEWMFGDAATGIMGFHGMASLNPLRWSGAISYEKGIHDMEEVLKHGTRPIVIKMPAGVSSKERKFTKPEEVVEFLKANDPKKRSLQEAFDHAVQQVNERETILVEATTNEKEANSEYDEELAASGKAKSAVCEWMFADAAAGMGNLFKVCARYNPTRWSGAQTYQKTIEDLEQLRKNQAELKEPPRSIVIRTPPGLSGNQEELKDAEAAIERLNKECGGEGVTALTTLQDTHIKTEEILKDAKEQLETAKKTLEEAKTKLTAA